MVLDKEITLTQFRKEMQHRVVKYPLHSRPVKEAVRFAKCQEDPAFYRIAMDKVHSQKQFQRELYGPSRFERIVDFVMLGSLREVVLTLLLVGGGITGLEVAKQFIHADPDAALYANMDVDELATRLGIALEATDSDQGQPVDSVEDDSPRAAEAVSKAATAITRKGATPISDADIERIAEALLRRMGDAKTAAASTAAATPVASVVAQDSDREATPN